MGYPLPFRYLPYVVSSLPAFEHMTILKTIIDFPRRGAKAPPPPAFMEGLSFPTCNEHRASVGKANASGLWKYGLCR